MATRGLAPDEADAQDWTGDGASRGAWFDRATGVLLLLALGVQLFYFDQATVNLREVACHGWRVGCLFDDQPRLYPADPGRVELAEGTVQYDPQQDGLLLARATLINLGDFTLGFPRIELQFFDSQGNSVAGRVFEPHEYLEHSSDLSNGMPGGEPLAVRMQLIDPGLSTLSFRYRLR